MEPQASQSSATPLTVDPPNAASTAQGATAKPSARPKQKGPRTAGIYLQSVVCTRIPLNITEVGKNVASVLLQKLSRRAEGVCTEQGYVKPHSIQMLTYSTGLVSGVNVLYDVSYQCLICRPTEGMLIRGCVVKNVTKAGVRALLSEDPSPVVVYVSRDHLMGDETLSNVEPGDIITVRVIGQRYELGDKAVSVVARLADPPVKPAVRLGLPVRTPRGP